MFKLALVLSTIPAKNIFRSALTSAFHSGFLDEFLICSGFFHERDNTKGPFYASNAFHTTQLPNAAKVTVVGAYEPASNEFDAFCNSLKTNLRTQNGSRVPVYQRRANKQYANKWHAKIFIAREHGKCIFAVIGSSNLTRNAFSAAAVNNEADVVIWNQTHSSINKLVNDVFVSDRTVANASESGPDVFVSTYDRRDPRNSHRGEMTSRLDQLWRDVMSATV